MTTRLLRTRPYRPFLVTLILASFVPVAAAGSRHRSGSADESPGIVDGSKFVDFAEEDETLIQLNLRAPLLKILSKAVHHEDKRASELLAQIEAVSAIIVAVSEDERDRITRHVAGIAEQLSKDGWDHIARVREDDTRVNVLALYDDETILGLVVMVYEDSEGQFVFANIAGKLDMALVGALGSGLQIPGLDQLTELDWDEHHRDRE